MNKKGSIIVYSLVFMLTFLTAVLALSTIFLNSLKINRGVSSSFKAYYAAESGLEKSLLETMENRDLALISGALSTVEAYSDTLPNSASYEITQATYLSDEIYFDELEAYEVKQLDLYNPDDLSSILGSFDNPSANLIITWTDTCEIEVSSNEWPEGSWPESGATQNQILTSSSPAEIGLLSGYDYIIRIRPINCSLPAGLRVNIEDETGAAVRLSNVITIKSQGEYGDFVQAMKAQFSYRAPLFDLGDFALFSEEDLMK